MNKIDEELLNIENDDFGEFKSEFGKKKDKNNSRG